MNVSQEQDR